MPYSHNYFSDALRKSVLVDAAFSLNGIKNIALLSNSVGSSDDIDYSEAIIIEQTLGLSVIKHQNKKPNVLKEITTHF